MTKRSKTRDYSRGMTCTLLLPTCTGNTEQTVGCHFPIPGTSGMGMKCSDLWIIDACHACHDHLDGRRHPRPDPQIVLEALIRTQQRRLNAGLINVK